jgi:mannosyl-3-phosphoglycerate phosphatase family protein
MLDDITYDSDASSEALAGIRKAGIPLVFCSSKTFSEQENLQKKLGICAPFIFENGSAIAIPQGYFPDHTYTPSGFSGDYDMVVFSHTDSYLVQSVIEKINRVHGLHLQGFSNSPERDLNTLTRLSGVPLERARDRMFTEILISPLDEKTASALNGQLAGAGLFLCKNARFNSIQSIGVDKGAAMNWLKQVYTKALGSQPVMAAIGDSANDESMLQAANIKFLVQRPGETWVNMEMKGLNLIKGVGPAGFNRAVQILMN